MEDFLQRVQVTQWHGKGCCFNSPRAPVDPDYFLFETIQSNPINSNWLRVWYGEVGEGGIKFSIQQIFVDKTNYTIHKRVMYPVDSVILRLNNLGKNHECSICSVAISFCSGLPDGNYKDPHNCYGFISCSNGLTYKMNCPAGLRYNYTINQCDWSANVPCDQGMCCTISPIYYFMASLARARAHVHWKTWRICLDNELCVLKNGSSPSTSTGTPSFF